MAGHDSYKLTYFDVKALGEPIRWIFAYAGVPFEDKRVPWDLQAWFTKTKAEFKTSVHQMPVLLVNGKDELCQSSAISRYLADKFGLLGDTAWDRARGDEVISLVFDLFDAWRKNAFERDAARKAANQPLVDQRFRLYFSKFNQLLEEREGDFLNGSKLTHADFWLASYVDFWNSPLSKGEKDPVLPAGVPKMDNSIVYVNMVDEFPALKKHMLKVLAVPQIKKWIADHPKTAL